VISISSNLRNLLHFLLFSYCTLYTYSFPFKKHFGILILLTLDLQNAISLKGPKREILVAGIFAQLRPIWIGYLGTRPKNQKKIMFGALNFTFNRRNICLAISATALKKLFLFSYVEKKGCFELLLYALQ
jgi:hypothetical protein